MLRNGWLLVVMACAPRAEVADPTGTEPSESEAVESAVETATESEQTEPQDTAPELYGTWLAEALPPPDFEVLDQQGETRTPQWLLGHPTVLWFFREASGSS